MEIAMLRLLKRHFIACAFAGLLAACGGGGGSSGGSSGGGTGGTPSTPATVAPTQAEAARVLTQATFGPTESSIQSVVSSGSINNWISAQISAGPASITHQAHVDAVIAANGSAGSNEFYQTWWRQAISGNDQLRQRVAFALSQIFVISLNDDVIDARGAASYYDMLTRDALGNYRTLLKDVTLHPMMGRYLTYLANQKEDAAGTRTPDENYAREVMQLMASSNSTQTAPRASMARTPSPPTRRQTSPASQRFSPASPGITRRPPTRPSSAAAPTQTATSRR